jgi:hypothetical protein
METTTQDVEAVSITRQDLLEFIESQFGEQLAEVGIAISDTQETLRYVIDDGLGETSEEAIYLRTTREVQQLLIDRQAAIGAAATEE